MIEYRLTDMETKFADIIWANAPLKSSDLVKQCEEKLSWKKSTTYTMLKRLEGKEIFKNENGVVSPIIVKEDFYAEQSKQFVAETFEGSLPRFVAAFTRRSKLSRKEIEELQRLIDEHRGE